MQSQTCRLHQAAVDIYMYLGDKCTVDSEMFARTLFSLIFANSVSREF